MTTRLQRERIIPVGDVDVHFDDAFVATMWREAHPKQPMMPAYYPSQLRSSARAYVELASRPSLGELGIELKRLHDSLIRAIEALDLERAAAALEQTPRRVVEELRRRVPGGISSPDDLRRPGCGIECAKDLLGWCVSGAEIVPGRRRPNGRRSRSTLRILPHFRQRRGYPRQEAEMMLVRSLGEFFYNRDGKFPGLASHGGRFAPNAGPFAYLVGSVLDRCGVSGVNPIKLVQRCLSELPKPDTLSPKKGQ